jgi:uncharacterized membrane protein
MYSRANIADHPIHPALVAFPIAFYTSTVIALVAHLATRDPFWFRAALTANIAGVVMAVVAAIPGAIDLFAGVPSHTRARSTGLRHAGYNVAALALFAVSAWLLWDQWYDADVVAGRVALESAVPLVIALVGLASTVIAGTLGWKLVQTHHVGVAPSTDLRARPRPEAEQPGGAVGRTASQVRPSLH